MIKIDPEKEESMSRWIKKKFTSEFYQTFKEHITLKFFK